MGGGVNGNMGGGVENALKIIIRGLEQPEDGK